MRCPDCESLRADAYAVHDRDRLILITMHYGAGGMVAWRRYGCTRCGTTFRVRYGRGGGHESWRYEMDGTPD